LIKQTIHLFNINKIKKLLSVSKKNLNPNGKICIFTLDPINSEIPTFNLMNINLQKSLRRDKKILNIIKKLYPKYLKKKFVYKVKISKKNYLTMIQNKYISTLLSMSKSEILNGISEVNYKYKKILNFRDKLICIIL